MLEAFGAVENRCFALFLFFFSCPFFFREVFIFLTDPSVEHTVPESYKTRAGVGNI